MSDFESYTLTEEDVEVEAFFGDEWGRTAGTYRAHGFRCSCGHTSSGWGSPQSAASVADGHLGFAHSLRRAESLSGLDRGALVEARGYVRGILRTVVHMRHGSVTMTLEAPSGDWAMTYTTQPRVLVRVTAPQEEAEDDPPGD